MNPKVLVIFHIYYPQHVGWFVDKMKNVCDADWNLLVTGPNLDEQVRSQVLSFKPDASFLDVENRGYDIGPFIQAVKTVDLDAYDIVVKLHTKNIDESSHVKFNGDNLDGHRWRDTLVDALLASPEAFRRVLHSFEDPKVGLVYSMSVNILSHGSSIEDASLLLNEMKRLDIRPASMEFCAGTIFAARAAALKYLKDDRIDVSVLPVAGSSHSTGTLSHSYERLLSIAVRAQGYTAALIPKSPGLCVYYKMKHTIQPILEWLLSINHYGDRNDKYLTLFGFRFRLSRT